MLKFHYPCHLKSKTIDFQCFCLIFKDMEVLDGDDVRVSSKGKEAKRDIVQVSDFRPLVLGMSVWGHKKGW